MKDAWRSSRIKIWKIKTLIGRSGRYYKWHAYNQYIGLGGSQQQIAIRILLKCQLVGATKRGQSKEKNHQGWLWAEFLEPSSLAWSLLAASGLPSSCSIWCRLPRKLSTLSLTILCFPRRVRQWLAATELTKQWNRQRQALLNSSLPDQAFLNYLKLMQLLVEGATSPTRLAKYSNEMESWCTLANWENLSAIILRNLGLEQNLINTRKMLDVLFLPGFLPSSFRRPRFGLGSGSFFPVEGLKNLDFCQLSLNSRDPDLQGTGLGSFFTSWAQILAVWHVSPCRGIGTQTFTPVISGLWGNKQQS